jgi:hypothetical protein
MAMMSRRNTEQMQKTARRRGREDDAPRLQEEVPSLLSLQLDVEDRSGVIGGTKYTRRIVVDRAPALFLAPCSDSRCDGDEHDLTAEVMRALHSQQTSFHGEDACGGYVGPSACPHRLRFNALATYRA